MRASMVAACAGMFVLAGACGSDGDGGGDTTHGTNDAAVADGADGATTEAATCPADHVCGASCCRGSEVCSFAKCVAPGIACADAADCPSDQYCDFVFADKPAVPPTLDTCSPTQEIPKGRCLPRPPVCANDAGPAPGVIDCLAKCQVPPVGDFKPVVKYAWGGQITAPFSTDIMAIPIVISLDDDNCDGKVDQNDIPEILFTTFSNGEYTKDGTLHVISIVNKQIVEKWTSPVGEVLPGQSLAAGNIDGKPGNEVIACLTDGHVRAYNGNGTVLWTSEDAVPCAMPTLADLGGDGTVEVILENSVLDGTTGKKKLDHAAGYSFAADIDGNGTLEIVGSQGVFDGTTGTQILDTAVASSWSAAADFDHDGKPEIVSVHYATHSIGIWRYDPTSATKFTWIRQEVDFNGTLEDYCTVPPPPGGTAGGGPLTIADFDGDGTPDVALAGGIGYTVLNGKKLMDPLVAAPDTIMWSKRTQDCSSAATGSSVFDFDGDGKAEVVYSDETHFRIYEGPTGNVLFETCNTTGTLVELPVVADVDNDGHADIVVVSNSYANAYPSYQCNDGVNISQSGLRIFGDDEGRWVRTRRIWNQHPYFVTNIEEDGTIPQHPLPNWKQPGLNNFRQNKAPGYEFAAPDAVLTVRPTCDAQHGLVAIVTNIGEAALPVGITVGFYSGTPPTGTSLGSGKTTRILLPAQSEEVVLATANVPAGATVYAQIEDAAPLRQCRTDNDVSPPITPDCTGIR